MSSGLPYKPKILRGAFVEYGLSIPPLFVVFQSLEIGSDAGINGSLCKKRRLAEQMRKLGSCG
jgi:hypothetical protein